MDDLTVRGALLGALIHGKGYGLELIERVEKRTKGRVTIKQPSVYPELRAMEEEGLVHSWEAGPAPERGGRPRRYYELTAEGRRAALETKKATELLFAKGVPA